MDQNETGQDLRNSLQQLLGYLNFSSGATDPKFLAAWNELFADLQPDESARDVSPRQDQQAPLWLQAIGRLEQELDRVKSEEPAFADVRQVTTVLALLKQHVIGDYRDFHCDLLGYLSSSELFGPFMLGRMCEAILQQGPPWDETDRICAGAIATLSDYIGHRPVPTLESKRIEPHAHEWVRPIPLYIEGAGVAVGRYRPVISKAFDLLWKTDADLLDAAWFDPGQLEELAIDPRAYDFDHPVNKRPNYHFGDWDPHCIDNRGRYRRFVIREVTLDALMSRIENERELPREELLIEGAAVLVGTMLMASGISGWGPEAHDSTTTLVSLIPRITTYRDAFYERLLDQMSGEHVERLRKEAETLRQPFGGARQHLNAEMSRRRAMQLQRVKLAKLFARMGYPEAAQRQTKAVAVSSARMLCDIDCCLTATQLEIEQRKLSEAADSLERAHQLIKRGIRCGAIVDPWNILGFDCHFSLFPALENSVHDHRIDELLTVIEQMFDLYSRLWCEVAASDNAAMGQRLAEQYDNAARWWHQFAAHEVASLETRSSLDGYEAASLVVKALSDWHQAGEARGAVGFWAPHVESFESPESYVLVIETLLDKHDFVSSLALLTHWLNHAEVVGLQSVEGTFNDLANRWLTHLLRQSHFSQDESEEGESGGQPWLQPWSWIRKCLDYLEANAEELGEVPQIDFGAGETIRSTGPESVSGDDLNDEDEDEDDGELGDSLFQAAYENVVYKDSTDDGIESELFDTDDGRDANAEMETDRVAEHLSFLAGQADLWTLTAAALVRANNKRLSDTDDAQRREISKSMRHWHGRAVKLRTALGRLTEATEAYQVPTPTGDHDSMVRYDRRRLLKEALLEQLAACSLSIRRAEQFLCAATATYDDSESPRLSGPAGEAAELDDAYALWLAAALTGDIETVKGRTTELLEQMSGKQILYVPLSRGGRSKKIIAARARQQIVDRLLVWLPRLGLLTEARATIETARQMELNAHSGPGAITQFDELYETGYREMLRALVLAFECQQIDGELDDEDDETYLVSFLEQLTESLLITWLSHSRTLRLSVLERVNKTQEWEKIVDFIKAYGGDLFSQRFLNLANTRGILHQGVVKWIEQLDESEGAECGQTLVESLGNNISYQEAADCLGVILEAIVENYQEYRDYNSTTTQSDRGDQLYMLLDFLRLKMAYDRVVWNLRPILLTHEMVVRRGHNEAAQLWRRALSERIGEEADQYRKRLSALQKQYAMRMASVSDRINERFMRQMTIDRMRALVEPSIAGRDDAQSHSFEILEEECILLLREPPGSGLDEPGWLSAIEEEVARAYASGKRDDLLYGDDFAPPYVETTLAEIQAQMDQWHSTSSGDGEEGFDDDDEDRG
jgi:hypothetical protein